MSEAILKPEKTLVEMRDLRIDIQAHEGTLHVVRGVDLTINRGQTLGLVGESGCGKSLTSKAILGINPKVCQTTGQIFLHDDEKAVDLLALPRDSKELRNIRGGKISMIFQEPMTAFSPYYTIGNQLMEMALLHVTRKKKEARQLVLGMMKKVGIANAEKRIDQYPHEFSGGMLQRALIAMALLCGPDLLIADEPTTALDVTIQAQILELMQALQQEMGMAILFITHDLGVVANMCDNIGVMYMGEIVEFGPADQIFNHPLHPYTKGLLRSVPKFGTQAKERLESIAGAIPTPIDLPPACSFFDRCEYAKDKVCNAGWIEKTDVTASHYVRCIRYKEIEEGCENG